MPETTVLKLSEQALHALMLALQKCLAEQSDITEILREFDLRDSDQGLVILNPPTVVVGEDA